MPDTEVKALQTISQLFDELESQLGGQENMRTVLKLSQLMNEHGEIIQDQHQIAAHFGASRSTAQRLLRDAIDAGLIRETRTGRANVYTLTSKVRECMLRQDRDSDASALMHHIVRNKETRAEVPNRRFNLTPTSWRAGTAGQKAAGQGSGGGGGRARVDFEQLSPAQRKLARQLRTVTREAMEKRSDRKRMGAITNSAVIHELVKFYKPDWIDYCAQRYCRALAEGEYNNLRNPAGLLVNMIRDAAQQETWREDQADQAQKRQHHEAARRAAEQQAARKVADDLREINRRKFTMQIVSAMSANQIALAKLRILQQPEMPRFQRDRLRSSQFTSNYWRVELAALLQLSGDETTEQIPALLATLSQQDQVRSSPPPVPPIITQVEEFRHAASATS